MRWSRPTKNDLLEIWSYLAEAAGGEIADSQLRNLHVTAESLVFRPFRGRPRDEIRPGLRSVLVDRYVMFYRVVSQSIEIVRVLHGRRDIETIFKKP